MSFVTEFRKNIPYLVEELSLAFGGGSDSWSIKEAYNQAETVLKDWISEYQTEINKHEQETSEE